MQVEIQFTFIAQPEHEDITNDRLFAIRHQIAEMLRDSGYGDIIEENENIFNQYANPYGTGYVGEGHHELFIGYTFDVNNDISHGNISSLLSQDIPNFILTLNNLFPDIHVNIRTTYLFN